jgi:hypothetical protein
VTRVTGSPVELQVWFLAEHLVDTPVVEAE